MTTLEFDQLLTFWHLKGKVTREFDHLGIKTTNTGQLKQLRRIQIKGDNKLAKIVYGEVLDDDKHIVGYEIEYADITNETGISKLYVRTDVLKVIQDF